MARTALYQHEILMVEIYQVFIKETYNSRLVEIKDKLEDATAAITKGVKQMITLRVASHLPIGM